MLIITRDGQFPDRSPEARAERRARLAQAVTRRMASQEEIQTQVDLQQELQTQVGSGFGDWIRVLATPIAEVMGKRHCSTCEARRIVTNAYGKLKEKYGQLEALKKIKDLWALSMKADGDQVLMRLKEMLHD